MFKNDSQYSISSVYSFLYCTNFLNFSHFICFVFYEIFHVLLPFWETFRTRESMYVHIGDYCHDFQQEIKLQVQLGHMHTNYPKGDVHTAISRVSQIVLKIQVMCDNTDHPKYIVSMGEDFLPFQRIIVPSFSSIKQPRIYESSATQLQELGV